MRKFLALLLALVMVLSMTTIAWAAEGAITGYKFVHLGKMMDMIKGGMDANEALAKASGQYGRVDDAAKLIDPRKE